MRVLRLAATLSLIATACVPLPHTHTQRPPLRLRIVDSAGDPVRNAQVVLYRGRPLSDRLLRFYVARADSAGWVQVIERHSWHMIFIAIPDAEAPPEWAWCVEAPGYRAEWRADDDRVASGAMLPLLARANAARCPPLVANSRHLAALQLHRDTLPTER